MGILMGKGTLKLVC